MQDVRYKAPNPPRLAEGWTFKRETPASRLFGANGIRTGADGRIYVAQVSGSQVSVVDPDTGLVEAYSPKGGDIVAPDDLAFDGDGNLYATEITEGRVSMRAPDGTTKVIYGDIPCANPIEFHDGRLIAGECRPGGRIMELSRDGGAPRMILEDIPLPNAMQVGPDGKLYFPVMGANEIWRVSLDGGAPEKVAGDLGVPDAVKFDAKGFIVSTQVASGQVLRIDPQTGDKTVLATVAPGLDNLTFVGERLFVSSISGQINEILSGGALRNVVPDGFNGPFALAMGADGVLFIADGPYSYTLQPGGERQVAGMLFTPNSPGYVRGAAALAPGEFVVSTSLGMVARWRPAAQESEFLAMGYDQLYGVALTTDDAVVVAEKGGGRVMLIAGPEAEALATGLDAPVGVAVTADGDIYATEEGAGRVVKLSGGRAEAVLDGLVAPQGIAAAGNVLFLVDVGAKELISFDTVSGVRSVVAADLPVGAPPGVTPKFLGAIGEMSGPMGPFAGVTVAGDGTIYVSGDAEGSVLSFRKG